MNNYNINITDDTLWNKMLIALARFSTKFNRYVYIKRISEDEALASMIEDDYKNGHEVSRESVMEALNKCK